MNALSPFSSKAPRPMAAILCDHRDCWRRALRAEVMFPADAENKYRFCPRHLHKIRNWLVNYREARSPMAWVGIGQPCWPK